MFTPTFECGNFFIQQTALINFTVATSFDNCFAGKPVNQFL